MGDINMIVDVHGIKIKLTNKEDYLQHYLLTGNFYEERQLKRLLFRCKKGYNIIDIGTNVGNHAFYFAKFFEANTVYVFEPNQIVREVFLESVKLNNFDCINTDYIHFALGNKVGKCSIDVSPENNIGATSLKPDSFGEISVTTGDSLFLDKQIDLIKIDVEGMEREVIEGLQETINKNKPIMFVEIRHQNRYWFEQWLHNNNYQILDVVESNLEYDNLIVGVK